MIPTVIICGLAILLGGALAARETGRRAKMQLSDGNRVVIVGTIKASGRSVRAPFTGTSCVVYRARAEQMPTPDDLHARFLERTEACPFEIDTGVECIAVVPDHVVLDIELTSVRPADVTQAAFVRGFAGSNHGAPHTFSEGWLYDGTRIEIEGTAVVEAAPPEAMELGYRDQTTVMRLVGDPRVPLTIRRV